MKYFLVSWIVKTFGIDNDQQVKRVVEAGSADEALLKDLIARKCLSADTTIQDVQKNQVALNRGEAYGVAYSAPNKRQSNAIELQIVETDRGIKIFVPTDISDWEESYKYISMGAQPYMVSIEWDTGAVQHTLKCMAWGSDVNGAAIGGVLSCVPADAEGNKDNSRKLLELSIDYGINIGIGHEQQTYTLSRIDAMKQVTVSINDREVSLYIPKARTEDGSPVIGNFIQ